MSGIEERRRRARVFRVRRRFRFAAPRVFRAVSRLTPPGPRPVRSRAMRLGINLDAVFPPMATVFDRDGDVDGRAISANVAKWIAGRRRRRRRARLERRGAVSRRGRSRSRDRGGAGLGAARSRAHRRHRPRVDARDHRRLGARGGARRGRGARAHAVVLQGADDARRVRAPLHGRRGRDAGAGAPLQRAGGDRRQPDAGRRRPAGERIRTSSA